jgi:two-component system, cell cycle response regulator
LSTNPVSLSLEVMASDPNAFDDEETPFDKTSVVQSDTFKVRLAQADQAPPCLVLLVGPANQVGRQWPIEAADFVIGRGQGAHAQVEDRSVSKAHAKIVVKAGEVVLIDLESTNKTVINNQIVTPLMPVRLKNNDQIKTGNIIFKFLERGNIETVSVAQTFDRGQTDPLTGAFNRGALNSQAVEYFNKSRMLGAPLSLMVFDIDFFKKTNDTFGHPAGDYVLKELSRVIRDTLIRGNDFFARYGGEEFCILFLGADVTKVKEIADRIRKTIEDHDFTFEGKKIPVTISAGIGTIQEDDPGWSQIFARADKALYQSKHGGRNRVTFQ